MRSNPFAALEHKLSSHFGYRPYVGPAGPTDKQVQRWTEQLADALNTIGVPFDWLPDPDGEEGERPEGHIVVVHNGRAAAYDRWGYVPVDDVGDVAQEPELDQANLGAIIFYLAGDEYVEPVLAFLEARNIAVEAQ